MSSLFGHVWPIAIYIHACKHFKTKNKTTNIFFSLYGYFGRSKVADNFCLLYILCYILSTKLTLNMNPPPHKHTPQPDYIILVCSPRVSIIPHKNSKCYYSFHNFCNSWCCCFATTTIAADTSDVAAYNLKITQKGLNPFCKSSDTQSQYANSRNIFKIMLQPAQHCYSCCFSH